MKSQPINNSIQDKITSLDKQIPADVQWKPEKSWDKINQKLQKPKRRFIIPPAYGLSVAACLVAMLLFGQVLFLNDHTPEKELGSIENEVVQHKENDTNSENTVEEIQIPDRIKEDQIELTNQNNKPYNQNSRNDIHVSKTQNTTAPIQKQVLIQNEIPEPDLALELTTVEVNMDTTIIQKSIINQEVSFSISDNARIRNDDTRLKSDGIKTKHLGKKKRKKFKVTISLGDYQSLDISNKVGKSKDKPSTKIQLKK